MECQVSDREIGPCGVGVTGMKQRCQFLWLSLAQLKFKTEFKITMGQVQGQIKE